MEPPSKCLCDKKEFRFNIFSFRFLFRVILVSLLFLFMFCFASYLQYGNIGFGLAYVSGYAIYAENTEVLVGEVEKGSEVSGIFQICNLVNRPVKIIGAVPDCSCVVIEDLLPFTLDPLGKQQLPFRLVIPSSITDEGEKTFFIRIFTDVDSSIFVLKIHVNIVKKQAVEDKTSNTNGVSDLVLGICSG